MGKSLADYYNRGLFGDYFYKNNYGITRGLYGLADSISGYDAVKSKEAEYQNSIDYYQYLKQGYDRQLEDWQKNVGSKGRSIRYPELSYAGYSYGASKNISNNYLGIDATYANYTASAPYRAGGLYTLFARASRYL